MWPRQRVRKARVAVISRFFLQSIPKVDNFGPIAPISTFHTILELTRQFKQLLLHVRRSSEGLNDVKFAFKDKKSKITQKYVKIGAKMNSIWLNLYRILSILLNFGQFLFLLSSIVDMNPFWSILLQFNFTRF